MQAVHRAHMTMCLVVSLVVSEQVNARKMRKCVLRSGYRGCRVGRPMHDPVTAPATALFFCRRHAQGQTFSRMKLGWPARTQSSAPRARSARQMVPL